MSNEKKVPVAEEDVYSTEGRWPVFIKLMAVTGVAAALGELVGTVKFPVGPGNVILLPMIFAMIFAVLVTPDALGSKRFAAKRKSSSPSRCSPWFSSSWASSWE